MYDSDLENWNVPWKLVFLINDGFLGISGVQPHPPAAVPRSFGGIQDLKAFHGSRDFKDVDEYFFFKVFLKFFKYKCQP